MNSLESKKFRKVRKAGICLIFLLQSSLAVGGECEVAVSTDQLQQDLVAEFSVLNLRDQLYFQGVTFYLDINEEDVSKSISFDTDSSVFPFELIKSSNGNELKFVNFPYLDAYNIKFVTVTLFRYAGENFTYSGKVFNENLYLEFNKWCFDSDA